MRLVASLSLAVLTVLTAQAGAQDSFLGIADELVFDGGDVVQISGRLLECGLSAEDPFALCGTEDIGEFELGPQGEVALGQAALAMPPSPAPLESSLIAVNPARNGARNPDPHTGRPRIHGSRGPCTTGDATIEPACLVSDTVSCASDPHPNCEFGANNADAFEDLCDRSRGSSPLDPSTCGLSAFASHALYSGVFPISQLLAQIGRGSGGKGGSTAPYIIADHTAVAEFDNIPQYYIDEVKKMLLSFPGESHAQGTLYGFENIEKADARFGVEVKWWTSAAGPEGPTDQHLRVQREFWDGDSWKYSMGEEHTWTSQTAIDLTNAHFAYARSLGKPYDAFVWGWCRDMTAGARPGGNEDPEYGVRWAGRTHTLNDGNQGRWGLDAGDTALTGNSLNMQSYIDAWEGYKTANPDMAIIYSTGTVDPGPQGDQHIGEWGYQRYLKNEYLRNWVRNEGGYLFDYADIISHNKSGERSTTTWNGHVYTTFHPDNVGEYGGSQNSSAHVGQDGTLMLGKALWVLLAKIKGWDGTAGGGTLGSDGGDNSAKNLFATLTGYTPSPGEFPDLNGDGLVDSDDLPLVSLVDDDQVEADSNGPQDGGPLWILPPEYDPVDDEAFIPLSGSKDIGLSPVLSNEQEALLGCGPFWNTNCDYDGIDLLRTEASAFLQSFVGLEETTDGWRTDDATVSQPGTAGFGGGAVCSVGDIGGSTDPRVVLPGCRGPGPDGVPNTTDDDPGYDVSEDGTPPNTPADLKHIPGHPFTGQAWKSEMAAFSWNAMMVLVGLSGMGKAPEERVIDEFSPLEPLRTNGCSFVKPQLCSAVQALLSYTAVTQIAENAGGNGTFGRRVWLWQTGAKYAVTSASGELQTPVGETPSALHAFGPSFVNGDQGGEEVPLLLVEFVPEPSSRLAGLSCLSAIAALARARRTS